MKYKVGIDVGGTKIEAAVLDKEDNVIARERVPTEREKGSSQILQNITNLLEKLFASHNITIEEIIGIGVGLPGSVDPVSKKMINGNTTCLVDVSIDTYLGESLGFDHRNIFTANDANCFALAESKLGVGKGHHPSATGVGIIIGTGCGGGIILNGKMFSGSRGGAGELGHTCIEPDGESCYCGRRGCAELYLSGKAVENHYLKTTGDKKYATDILQDKKFRKRYKSYFTQFLLNIVNSFDPEYIVFGGGLSKDNGLWEETLQELKKLQFLKTKELPQFYQNSLGDSAGVFGAAMLVSQSIG
jgi:fructokinase